MKFKDAKKELLQQAKSACACVEEYKRAIDSESHAELITVIKENAQWCINNKVISVELLEKWFELSVLAENYLFISGEHSVRVTQDVVIVLLGSSTANVESWGSSKLTYTFEGGILRDRGKRKIFIKKSNFEIELID